jgi:trans-4-hydroxy-L-proline dehydratase
MTLRDAVGPLREELRAYYRPLRHTTFGDHAPMLRVRDAVWAEMDAFAAADPRAAPWTLKARLHTLLAEHFDPVIFANSPFYYEMGLRPAENWGNPTGTMGGTAPLAAEWLMRRGIDRARTHPAYAHIRRFGPGEGGLAIAHESIFDFDHHVLGSTHLLEVGVNGLLDEIGERLSRPVTAEQASWLAAATDSCLAVIKIAARFADAAERALACMGPAAPDATVSHLAMIAKTARRVPAEPPRTFYEGLAALWFLREVAATVEGIGISVIGHLDRQLGNLYEADLAAGRLTETVARDLLARWLLPTDVKFFVDENSWPETSTCIEIGGCDDAGAPVFNALTRLILEVHAELDLLNPKLQCRYATHSPQAYLDLVGEHVLHGRNVYSLLNDDVLIPACVRAGKSEPEARRYVNGGCQETIVEGVEHSAGAYYYFNMPRVLDLCLQPASPAPSGWTGAVTAEPTVITAARDFDDFYTQFMEALGRTIAAGAAWRREVGGEWVHIHPCPFFSATLADAIENARDYTTGGARHNPAGVALVGLATLVDSLHAIRVTLFEEGWLSLEALQDALARDWEGHERLRAQMAALPKFGHGSPQVDALAGRVADDLAALIAGMENERGGHFQPSFFVYYAFVAMGKRVRATPDGRRAGDLLSQGLSPAQLRAPTSLTDTFRSLSAVDLTRYPGNAVLDVQLPLGAGLPAGTLTALLRTFAELGGATLQPNVVSIEALRDAQRHPERHQALTVRICGLSARFVALTREVQDEIIGRHLAGV